MSWFSDTVEQEVCSSSSTTSSTACSTFSSSLSSGDDGSGLWMEIDNHHQPAIQFGQWTKARRRTSAEQYRMCLNHHHHQRSDNNNLPQLKCSLSKLHCAIRCVGDSPIKYQLEHLFGHKMSCRGTSVSIYTGWMDNTTHYHRPPTEDPSSVIDGWIPSASRC